MPPQYGVHTWYGFENLVANLFRGLGVKKVVQNVSLAGHQIDIYLEEETPTTQIFRTAVECKYHQKPVGKDIVTSFALIMDFLRKASLIDRGILVSYKGYTKEANLAAEPFQIELLKVEDLEARASKYVSIDSIINKSEKDPPPKFGRKLLFVLMPFSKDYEDLYVYGIIGAAEKTDFVCRRADEIEHNAEIIDEILYQIDKAYMLVGEITERNANVCYEVGIAHGKGKEVILVAKQGTEIPFDLRGKNFILYENIYDLEQKLTRRLYAIINENGN